ncbi:unnamed protein product [Allacma fusca]|uniref:Uncharacterized protein n=1 Tax=Allacma fusca TaxID=39272 RepID=A0A8J2PY64_9HEXA|nr:unnamed protein product [Allacma fusca]
MSSSAFVNALLTNALMGGLLWGVNIFAEVTKDEQAKITGVVILGAITTATLFAFVRKWNTVRTWTVLRIPRNYALSSKKSLGNDTQPISWGTSVLLVAGSVVVVAKALVLAGVRNGLLDIIRLNDPLIFLDDVEKTTPFIQVVIWQHVLVSLPLFAISIFYHFKTTKPAFLWEVAVANFAFLLTGQFIFIVGAFNWKTPEDLRVDPTNGVFWIINLIPLIASLAQIESLSLYKSSFISQNPKVKKRS